MSTGDYLRRNPAKPSLLPEAISNLIARSVEDSRKSALCRVSQSVVRSFECRAAPPLFMRSCCLKEVHIVQQHLAYRYSAVEV